MRNEFTLEFTKVKVLAKLEANYQRYKDSRGALLEAYKEASEKYQEEFKEYSRKVFEGELTEDDDSPTEPRVPQDQSKKYESWIGMLKGSMSDSMILSYNDYQQLILDEWSFIREHIMYLRDYSTTTSNSMTSTSLATFADSYETGNLGNW